MIFLDTNVVSELMRPLPHEQVVDWLTTHETKTALSAVVIAEISYGIERIRPEERSRRLARTLHSLIGRHADRLYSFDDRAALIYGKLADASSRRGRPISVLDGMIAATALRFNGQLATRNVTHFAFEGLRLVNPWVAH